jgi:putative drug exporter of the RND superfamily
MIGLGVGIDYALFIVTRHLEQRRDGMERRESIARSCASSGGAVVFAGCTVMVALLSLAVVNIPLVTTLGYTSALVVAVAVLAAIMLLRAILGIVGDRIDKLPIPLPHRKADDRPHGWLRWGGFVARHPLPAAVVAIVVLGALALPTLDIYLGQQDNGAMPESTDARRASDGLTGDPTVKQFGVGMGVALAVDATLVRCLLVPAVMVLVGRANW